MIWHGRLQDANDALQITWNISSGEDFIDYSPGRFHQVTLRDTLRHSK